MPDRIAALQKQAADTPDLIGLAGGLPATDVMPKGLLGRVLADVARDNDALQYGWPEGLAALRTWVADRLTARGAPVDAERVIITSGAQQALSLIGMEFRGQRIAVGSETYPAAISAFVRAGARAVVDDGEVDYTMPGVANPSGRDLVEPVRARWLQRAALIADEAYAELRFDGALARPLLHDAPDRVWHVGTLSKTVAPGLRVGWLVPPVREHAAVLELKEAVDLQASSITQAVAATLLDRLDYDAHLARARAAYARRAAALCEAVRSAVPAARFDEPEGGFAIWVELDAPGDEVELLAAAIRNGTSLDPGCMFRPPGGRADKPAGFRLSFSSAPLESFAEGARRLARAIEEWRAGR